MTNLIRSYQDQSAIVRAFCDGYKEGWKNQSQATIDFINSVPLCQTIGGIAKGDSFQKIANDTAKAKANVVPNVVHYFAQTLDNMPIVTALRASTEKAEEIDTVA